ncbi:unnamed protein product [Brachionus calyciflorus]|uniref:Uncharacterized protein n=1 Tax=Brachionus calyciflorus TaxID=104777 RepID=A0A814BW25_9BILA|nr:unnamed protein product [Brachionus calyciflorus]
MENEDSSLSSDSISDYESDTENDQSSTDLSEKEDDDQPNDLIIDKSSERNQVNSSTQEVIGESSQSQPSSNKRKRFKSSSNLDFDNYFKKENNGYQCKVINKNNLICNQILSQKSSTTSLRYHLKNIHGINCDYVKKTNKISKPKIDEKLVEWIIDDLQAINVVTNKKFGELMNTLDPNYQIPSRNKIDSIIDQLYEKKIIERKQILEKIKSKFHCTSDIWTSSSGDSYISLTLHFINNNNKLDQLLLDIKSFPGTHNYRTISSIIDSILDENGIKQRIASVTSDNASNMIKAFSRLKKMYQVQNIDIVHIRCFAHILHLITSCFLQDENVKSAIKNLRLLLKKIKKKSLKTTLKALCVINREPEITVILDTKTRWNSTYDMIIVALKIKKSLNDLTSKPEHELVHLSLTNEEWNIIENFKEILEPFKKATLDLSSQNLSTSHLYPIIDHLDKHLNKMVNKREYFLYNSAFQKMSLKFEKYWKEIEEFIILSHIIDPRFKLTLIDRNKKNYWKQRLRVLMRQHPNFDQSNQTSTNFVEREFSLIESILYQNDLLTNNEDEIDKFFGTPIVGMNIDPIEWWRLNYTDFSNLSKIAMDYIGAVPTSIQSERYFSIGGLTVTKLRNRLLPEKVNKLMVLWSCGRYFENNKKQTDDQV